MLNGQKNVEVVVKRTFKGERVKGGKDGCALKGERVKN